MITRGAGRAGARPRHNLLVTDSGPSSTPRSAPPPVPPPPASAPTDTARRRGRFLLAVVAIVVVLVADGVLVVVLLNRGDGTSRTATPLEVRRRVAVFPCTPDRPGTPENLRLTAGQEVVKVPRAGCAVVGTVLARVDRASKVAVKTGNPCTVPIDAPTQY